MKHGADWYKRVPAAYLGGVQGLTAQEHAVYSVVLDLIYHHGGAVNNDPRWIAGWISDMGPAAVRKTIAQLVSRGKLEINGDEITQRIAKNEAKTKEELSETRAQTGKIGGINSGISRRKPIENNDLHEANEQSKTKQIREDKNREDKEEEDARGAFEFFGKIREAVGVTPDLAGPYWSDDNLAAHVEVWHGHGLTDAEILAQATASRNRNPDPPDGPKALDRWMAATARAKTGRPTVAAQNGVSPSLTQPRADTLRFYADWINGDKRIYGNVITPSLAREIIDAGLVTQARMQERGLL